MEGKQEITTNTLQNWLENKENVVVLDVRPKEQREEWQIPGSIYVDAYQRLNANDPSVLDEVSIPENAIVVTVCAAGRTSNIAAKELRKKGIEAYSLDGGMKAWSMAWNKAEIKLQNDIELVQARRTGKGCLSYIIASKGLALIIDPSLDIEDYESILKEKRIAIKICIGNPHSCRSSFKGKVVSRKNKCRTFSSLQKVMFIFHSHL